MLADDDSDEFGDDVEEGSLKIWPTNYDNNEYMLTFQTRSRFGLIGVRDYNNFKRLVVSYNDYLVFKFHKVGSESSETESVLSMVV